LRKNKALTNPVRAIFFVIKFQFSGQCPQTKREVLAGRSLYTKGPSRFVPAVQISVYRSVG